MGNENIRRGEESPASDAVELSPHQEEILGIVAEINRTESYVADLRKLPQTERTIKNISEAQELLTSLSEQKESLQKPEEVAVAEEEVDPYKHEGKQRIGPDLK